MILEQDRPFSSVWARHAMVSSCHPLASQAGMDMLTQGGSAIDAAIAMAWATSVLMPDMCGPGGEAFCLVKDGLHPVRSFMGSGVLPRDFDMTTLEPGLTLPLHGGASVSVPGSVDLYARAHRALGRLAWKDVMEPAIRLAREGFPCDTRLHESLVESESLIGSDPAVRAVFYPEGRPLAEGELVRQRQLANTLERIAESGREAFYFGTLAESMVRAVGNAGGFLSLEDLLQHTGEESEPIRVPYRDYEVYQTPLPTPGVVMLEALRILEHEPYDRGWRDSGELVHKLVEALRLAFQDRRDLLGDPAYAACRPDDLLNDAWIVRRREELGPKALAIDTALKSGDTTSFVAVDNQGMAVSFIHSLALQFGSGVYVPEGGYFLNNRSGRSFNRIEGHPNQAVPGKRPMHTLNTYLVTHEDEWVAVGNTPGGDGQPQWNLMALLDVLSAGRLPHEAVSLPRLAVAPATDAHALDAPTVVAMESRFAPAVIEDLRQRGHEVRVLGPYEAGGTAQLIIRRQDGFAGASDPRGIGQTQGY